MKRLFWAALLLATTAASAQSYDYTTSYYPAVNRAELLILGRQYASALRVYDSLFRQAPYALARDCYNALACALEVKDAGSAWRFADSLLAKGTIRKFFETDEGLAALRELPEWTSFASVIDARSAKATATLHPELKAKLEQMRIPDQEFRVRPGSYRRYEDSIRYNDSLNIAELRQIMNVHGFPGEQLLGKKNPRSVYFHGYILVHHYCQELSKRPGAPNQFQNDLEGACGRGGSTRTASRSC